MKPPDVNLSNTTPPSGLSDLTPAHREPSPHEISQRASAPIDRANLKITLVPGTWGYGFFRRRANLYRPSNPPRWFENSSQFRQTLEAELRRLGFTFHIEVLQWDGSNSVQSRAVQADRLAAILKAQRSPGVRRVVIAHSHGGNIACRAASLVEVSNNDLDVVTLATPFLQASTRQEDSPQLIADLLVILLGVMSAEAFIAASAATRLLAGLKTLAVWILVLLYIWSKYKGENELANMVNTRVTPGVRILAIRGFTDEASAAIVLGSIAAGLMNALFYALAAPLRWFMGADWRIALMIALFLAAIALLVKKASVIFQVVPLWTVITYFAVLVLVPVLISGIFASILGRELFFQSLKLIFTVDSVPDCGANADVVTLSQTHTSMAGLRHGIYAHGGCPRLIAYWLATGNTWHYQNGVPYSTIVSRHSA